MDKPIDEAQARDAFEAALRSYHQDFDTFFLLKLYGMHVTYADQTCTVAMTVRDFMFNPQGSLHGGVSATLLDISMGHLLRREVGAGATLAMNIQYTRAVREGQITATSRFSSKGRQICFLQSDVRDADGKLLASATSTWKVL
ncbi:MULTISPECIES: PaaI family thioesterase [Pandoraea]|uniref:PaaI family thioesterase n=1 Tax=Pandoraea TaxID=93217 RepID=UPI001F5D378C|nr:MULTISPECIES: PaaI family thioesterase [Pandoraea]